MVTILPGQTKRVYITMNRIKNRKMLLKLFRNKIRVTGFPKGHGKVEEYVYGTRIRMSADENEELGSVTGNESQKENMANEKEYLPEFAPKES